MIDLISHLDKDRREQCHALKCRPPRRRLSLVDNQTPVLVAIPPRVKSHRGHGALNDTRISEIETSLWCKREVKDSFAASLRAVSRTRGGETVVLTVIFYRQIQGQATVIF
jgi:hypothetical protein